MKLLSILFFLLTGLSLSHSVWAYKEAEVQQLFKTGSCSGCDLSFANLTAANLRGATLRGTNFNGANLSNADLRWADMSSANLSRADLRGADLTLADLEGSKLSGATLSGAYLYRVDLNRMNLSGINLTGATLTGSILSNTNLSGANLSGADLTGSTLRGADLSNARLDEANLSGVNLTEANLRGAYVGDTVFPIKINAIAIKEVGNYQAITSFEMSGDSHYMTSKTGKLYVRNKGELTHYGKYVRSYPDLLAGYDKAQDQTIEEFGIWHWQTYGKFENRLLPEPNFKVGLDLSNDPRFFDHDEAGLLSVVTRDNLVYISYTVQDDPSTEDLFLVIDEYSKTLKKFRTIQKIPLAAATHIAGTLLFDKYGKLYVSVGDGGGGDVNNQAQDIHSLKGKIFRMDISTENPKLEVVAYGLRNPWKYHIDGQDRMFIGNVGGQFLESVYVLDKLYPTSPANLGWPIFEGTKRRKDHPLRIEEIVSPIYEYRHHSDFGISVIGGLFLEDMNVYLFGDLLGNLRLLKQRPNGKWDEIYYQKIENEIFSFGYDRGNRKIYISDWVKIYELEISIEEIKSLPGVVFCRTIMPNRTINSSGC